MRILETALHDFEVVLTTGIVTKIKKASMVQEGSLVRFTTANDLFWFPMCNITHVRIVNDIVELKDITE